MLHRRAPCLVWRGYRILEFFFFHDYGKFRMAALFTEPLRAQTDVGTDAFAGDNHFGHLGHGLGVAVLELQTARVFSGDNADFEQFHGC